MPQQEHGMKEKVTLLYDGDCPICSRYRDYIALRRKFGMELLDARRHADLVRELREKDYDIDQGMILLVGERIYHRGEVLVLLEAMIRASGTTDRMLQWAFRRPRLMKLIYPVLYRLRWLMMKAQGKQTRID